MNSKLFLIIVTMTLQINAFAQISNKIEKEVSKQTISMLELCKQFHQNPELSFQEFETSKRMAAELRKAGFEVTENFGGNNVVGIFKNGEGPSLMLRTDMDALPVEEETGFEFASTKKVKNRMGMRLQLCMPVATTFICRFGLGQSEHWLN